MLFPYNFLELKSDRCIKTSTPLNGFYVMFSHKSLKKINLDFSEVKLKVILCIIWETNRLLLGTKKRKVSLVATSKKVHVF